MGSKVKKYSKVKIVCPIFLFLVAIVCASMPTASKTQNPMKASWNGRYQHVSRAFELLLKKFDVDSVAVDIIRTDPAEKSETVASFFAVLLTRQVKSLSETELESLVKAIQRKEGWREGKIVEIPFRQTSKKTISAVRKNKKGTIIQYYVDSLGWLSKAEAISLFSMCLLPRM